MDCLTMSFLLFTWIRRNSVLNFGVGSQVDRDRVLRYISKDLYGAIVDP